MGGGAGDGGEGGEGGLGIGGGLRGRRREHVGSAHMFQLARYSHCCWTLPGTPALGTACRRSHLGGLGGRGGGGRGGCGGEGGEGGEGGGAV